MPRRRWAELPADVLDAAAAHTGPVLSAASAPSGEHSDIAATLHTAAGLVFVKGIRTEPDGPDLRSLRRERRINPYVTEYAPRLLWEVEAGGWLLLGFEHVQGRHAAYTPGSPDLELLADLVHRFQSLPCPEVVTMRVERRWAGYADDLGRMCGDTMLHMDLNPENLLITPVGRVAVVDWGFACRGAAWVELANLVQWLIAAGHAPGDAEKWLSRFPAWQEAPPDAIDQLAQINAARWRDLAAQNPAQWATRIAGWVQQWADYRS